jgi:protein TonB
VISLAVHASVFLPSLFHFESNVRAPTEIPVEIVTLPPQAPPAKPPPKPPAPKQVAQRQDPPKPAPKPAKPAPPSPQERLAQLLGQPALALPGAGYDGGDDVSYGQLVLSQVAKAKKMGRYPGTPGATSVSFTLSDTGEIATVAIVRSSGQKWLDDEAIAMIRRAAPYPPPPPGARRDFTVTLRFEPVG